MLKLSSSALRQRNVGCNQSRLFTVYLCEVYTVQCEGELKTRFYLLSIIYKDDILFSMF